MTSKRFRSNSEPFFIFKIIDYKYGLIFFKQPAFMNLGSVNCNTNTLSLQ